MSSSQESITYFLDCLAGVPELRTIKMFGNYAILSGNKTFALVCENILYFKTFPETLKYFEDTKSKAYKGSKNTAPANEDWLEDTEKLVDIVFKTLELTPEPRPKKKKL